MALTGVRVVDLTRVLAGPFCTALLADMGAEVIKIEAPDGGDPVRRQGVIPQGMSWYFAQFNRNKRSLTLDLYSEQGKQVLADLLADADVLVENYRPGVLARMGFTPERLDKINPRLVVTSINGYGATGPFAARPAFDFIAQAMSGFMSVNGAEGTPPMRVAPPVSDLVAGLYAAFGTVCALHRRQADGAEGRGQQVETSLVNGLISMLAYLSAEFFATGELPPRTGNDHPIVAPYGLFRAADGDIAVAPSNDVFVERFLAALGLAALLERPEFADNQARMRHREDLKARINEVVGSRPVAYWIEQLNAAGVPCGRPQNLHEVFADPQVQAQEMVIEASHADGETIKMTGFPVKLSATPCALRRPAPELGADSEGVLAELGYDAARIAALRQAGVI